MSEFNQRTTTELLQTFKRAEVREFRNYVAYKGSKNARLFWEVIKSHHPYYAIEDEIIFKKITPQKAFNDQLYRVWVAELTKLAKGFIAMKAFEANNLLYNNTLSMALLERRAQKMGQKIVSSQEKELEKVKRPSTLFYKYCYQLHDTAYQFVTVLNHRKTTKSLQKAADFLDYSFLAQKLKFLSVMRNRRRIVKEDYVFKMESQLLEYLHETPHTHIPLIHLYYLMLRMVRDLNDHESFNLFLAFFKDNYRQIHPTEARQLMTGALNFCLWNIRLGKLDFLMPRMELTLIMDTDEFILVNGVIPQYQFRSLMKIAIEAKRLGWAENFLQKWLPKTVKKHRPEIEAYHRAYLHFAKGEYNLQANWMAIMNNENFNFNDIQTKVTFRVLKLKTTFVKLGKTKVENDAFNAQLEAFRNFLSRKSELPKSTQKAAGNFYKALKQLHSKKQGKTSRVGDLKTYILNLNPIRELPWLLEMVALQPKEG